MNHEHLLRSTRRAAVAAVVLAFTLTACSSTTGPGPTTRSTTASLPPTAAPTTATTPLPTPAPTIMTLTAADLGEGWTIIATETNVSGVGRSSILGPIKIGTSFAFVCVGVGTARVSFGAAGGTLTTGGANEFFSKTYTCPTEVNDYLTDQFDAGGISLNPDVAPSTGVIYQLIAGTQP
jgi:hypothetical protein